MKIENISLPHHITVDAVTIQKMNYLLDHKYSCEFTGFCHAEKRENGEYHISDIFFPRQDNASTTTECNSEDIIDLMKEGLDISKTTGHIHSHVDMGVFASTTDKKDIVERAKDAGFNAAVIMNKKGKIFGHIADMELGIYIEDCPVYVDYPFTQREYESKILEEIKNATTLDDVEKLLTFDNDDYMEMNFPLSQETKDFLEEVVKTRFQFVSYNYKNSSKNKKKETKIIPLSNDEYDDWNHLLTEEDDEYAQEMADFFTPDELLKIPSLFDKSCAEMTESEWQLFNEVTTFYPYYSPKELSY